MISDGDAVLLGLYALSNNLELAPASTFGSKRIPAERNETQRRCALDRLARSIVSELEIEPADLCFGRLCGWRGEIQGHRVQFVGVDATPRAASVRERTEARLAPSPESVNEATPLPERVSKLRLMKFAPLSPLA